VGLPLGVDVETIRHIAELARIKLDDEELEEYARHFQRVLEFFKAIDEVDVEGVEPMYHVIPTVNVFREDTPEKPLDVEVVLKNAPKKKEKYFYSPPIV